MIFASYVGAAAATFLVVRKQKNKEKEGSIDGTEMEVAMVYVLLQLLLLWLYIA